MQTEQLRIPNTSGEELDVLIEGTRDIGSVIVFMHGFGTDKNEGFDLFVDISQSLIDSYTCLRFDQSGWGASDGKTEEFHLQKAAGDLKAILEYVRLTFPDKKLHIIAHSLGTFETAILSPLDIEHIIFTGIPNADGKYIAQRIQNRIVAKNGELNIDGVSIYPRTGGKEQRIGKELWSTLGDLDIISSLKKLSMVSKVTIFKPMQDNIVGQEHFEAYKTIPNIDYREVDGDHNFSNFDEREVLIKQIHEVLV